VQVVIVSKSKLLSQYIQSIQSVSESTANQYNIRLNKFELFLLKQYGKSLETIIDEMKHEKVNPYEILNSFCGYLKPRNLSASTIIYHIVTAKNFLEFHDVEISPRKFKLKVKLPKVVRKDIQPITKQIITNILNSCSDIRLKTYVMLLAATGMRASEALSIRLVDCNLNANPPRLQIRGEYTKTKVSRFVFLTQELVHQISLWLEYKHRTRRVCTKGKENEKTQVEYRTLKRNDRDLLFAVTQNNPNIKWLYNQFASSFGKTLDRMGLGERDEVDHGRRRNITLHSMRRFVKSAISDLGYGDFSEFMIGHSSSTYYRRTVDEKAALFRKIEPYLTFLDYQQLERRGADISAQLQEKDKQIQTLVKKQEQFEQLLQSLIDSGQLKPGKTDF